MKIYREVGSLPIVNREDAEGYARPVYSIEVEEAVPIEDYQSMERTVNKLIKALAEAVPVVRCKDCIEFAGEGMYCGRDIIVHYDHFYCYYGDKGEEVTE